MTDQHPPAHGWTVVLRRRPARMVAGRPVGGWTEEFEIVCCYCGDDPDLDYREVSPVLQQIRGPYPLAAGVTAYLRHARRHPGPAKSAGPAAAGARGRHRLTAQGSPAPAARGSRDRDTAE